MSRMHHIHRQAGMSIPEMMIGLLLSSMIMVGMISLFVQSQRSFRQDDIIARMQEDARFALTELQRDLAQAGFWADLLDPNSIQNDASVAGALFVYATPIVVADNVAGSVTLLGQSTPDIVPGTDAFVIAKLAGNPTSIAEVDDDTTDPTKESIVEAQALLEDEGIYLQTNGVIGRMYRGADAPVAPSSVPVVYRFWRYDPVVYWVRSWAVTAGDGIPTLCRKVLTEVSGSVDTECLSQGIADLQIEFGIDTDGDDYADRYVSDPTAAQMLLVTTARIFILARATTADPNYVNDKTYTYSNSGIAPAAPGDGFYRRVYATTIMVRNNAHLLTLRQ